MKAGARTGVERERKAAAPELVQLAAFTVGGEPYAIDIMRIKEIIHPIPITRVPRAPAFLEGVIELRRSILPVIDLRRRFEVSQPVGDRGSKYLIVSIDSAIPARSQDGVTEPRAGAPRSERRWIVGLVVDAVKEVIRIPREEVRPAPAMALGDSARYFSGVCRHRGGIVLIIDLDALLSGQERITLSSLGDPSLGPAGEA